MKKIKIGLLVVAAGLPLFANQIRHRFLISNFMGKSLHYVDQFDSSNNWEIKLNQIAMDMQLVGDDQLMVNANKGYDLYDLKLKKKIRSFSSDKIRGVKSMRRLPDGRTFFSNQDGFIYEFDKQDKFVAEYQMPAVAKYARMMRFSPDGNILLACNDGAYELSLKKDLQPEERMVKKFLLPRPRNAYMALYAPDGKSVYLSGGYSKGFYTFNTDGKLLKESVIPQPDGLHNYFYAGFQVLRSGHIILANWTGHSLKDFKPGLKLVELDKDHNVVWSWNEDFGGTVNQVIVLDELDTSKLNVDTSGVLQ